MANKQDSLEKQIEELMPNVLVKLIQQGFVKKVVIDGEPGIKITEAGLRELERQKN